MARLLLVWRLARRDLLRRPTEALMLLLAMAAATSTLALGLIVHGGSSPNYLITRNQTAGPDVVATSASNGPGHATTATELAALKALSHAPAVAGHSGPYPIIWAHLQAGGREADVMAEARSTAPASVDQPKPTKGSWVRPGGIVVEQSFADALGVHVGDQVKLNGQPFRVGGIAVTAAIPPYPNVAWSTAWSPFPDPGLIWITQTGAARIASPSTPSSYLLNLKLANPALANTFVQNLTTTAPITPFVTTWADIDQEDSQVLHAAQRILLTASWLLTLLAMASLTVLVGGRLAEQSRRIGLLKAVGATPWLVTSVLVVENLLLATISAGAGLAIGWLIAPLLNQPTAGLLGAAAGPTLTGTTLVVVEGAALAIALIATVVPAYRAGRISTINALADTAHLPRRRPWLVALSTHLPATLLIGLRIIGRRPRRAALNALSVAVTVSGIIAVILAHASNARSLVHSSGLPNPRTAHLNEVLLVITTMLITLAAVNAVFITWAVVQDAKRTNAVARALGATAVQVSYGLSVAQIIPSAIGTLLGIPGGVGLYLSVRHGATIVYPPVAMIAAGTAVVLVIAALVAIVVRLGNRRSVADMLQ